MFYLSMLVAFFLSLFSFIRFPPSFYLSHSYCLSPFLPLLCFFGWVGIDWGCDGIGTGTGNGNAIVRVRWAMNILSVENCISDV